MKTVYQLAATCSETLEGFGNQKIYSKRVFGSKELAELAKLEFMQKCCDPECIPCFVEEKTAIAVVELELLEVEAND